MVGNFTDRRWHQVLLSLAGIFLFLFLRIAGHASLAPRLHSVEKQGKDWLQNADHVLLEGQGETATIYTLPQPIFTCLYHDFDYWFGHKLSFGIPLTQSWISSFERNPYYTFISINAP